jgi:hypothetical protein
MTDWGTSVDLGSYSRKREHVGRSIYERMVAVDCFSATSAIASASMMYADIYECTPAVMERIGALTAYCLAGYFNMFDPDTVMEPVERGFRTEGLLRAQDYEGMCAANRDAVEKTDSVLSPFLLRAFFSLAETYYSGGVPAVSDRALCR